MRLCYISDAGQDKPVLVVSSGTYAALVAQELVVVCRKISKANPKSAYEVGVSAEEGAVVCSHVLTVPRTDLRPARFAAAVTPAEQAAVRSTLYRYFGLSGD